MMGITAEEKAEISSCREIYDLDTTLKRLGWRQTQWMPSGIHWRKGDYCIRAYFPVGIPKAQALKTRLGREVMTVQGDRTELGVYKGEIFNLPRTDWTTESHFYVSAPLDMWSRLSA